MLRTLIRLSNGTEISSGSNADMNIRSCTITQCVNSGDDLTIGSVCAACVEMVVQVPANTFESDDVFTLYKVDDADNRTQIGVFNVFEPQKKGERLCKVTAYDNVIKLDKDITEWFGEVMVLPPRSPLDLTELVCEKCGVVLGHFPQYDSVLHEIRQASLSNERITGRKIIQWIAEMLGCYCVADTNGELGFRWYVDKTDVVLSGTGNRFRMQGSYKRKNEILPIDSVKIVISNGVWGISSPENSQGNQYVIRNNPFLEGKTSMLGDIAKLIMRNLEADREIFAGGYADSLVACEVSIPASLDINVGDIIVVDEQGREQGETHVPTTYMRVMTKIQKGQKDTLQCVGSYRRRN